jgi:hypothetical protein
MKHQFKVGNDDNGTIMMHKLNALSKKLFPDLKIVNVNYDIMNCILEIDGLTDNQFITLRSHFLALDN